MSSNGAGGTTTASQTPAAQAPNSGPIEAGVLRSGRKRLDLAEVPLIIHKKRIRNVILDHEIVGDLLRELGINKAFYESGRVLAWAIHPDEPDFTNIHDYIARGQKQNYGLRVESIVRIIAKGDPTGQVPLDFCEDPQVKGKSRMMLWMHQTKKDVVASILENGVRIPAVDPKQPSKFGAGIYFIDRVSKHVDNNPRINSSHYLLLCDVLLGVMYESKKTMPNLTQPPFYFSPSNLFYPVRYDSVKGVGLHIPEVQGHNEIEGCIWPLGPTVQDSALKANKQTGQMRLSYNEYVVYRREQVQPKYLVKVQVTPAPVFEKIC